MNTVLQGFLTCNVSISWIWLHAFIHNKSFEVIRKDQNGFGGSSFCKNVKNPWNPFWCVRAGDKLYHWACMQEDGEITCILTKDIRVRTSIPSYQMAPFTILILILRLSHQNIDLCNDPNHLAFITDWFSIIMTPPVALMPLVSAQITTLRAH